MNGEEKFVKISLSRIEISDRYLYRSPSSLRVQILIDTGLRYARIHLRGWEINDKTDFEDTRETRMHDIISGQSDARVCVWIGF